MFRNLVISAVGAGLVVCVALSLVQTWTTEPLILHAEQFESAASQDHAAVPAAAEAQPATPSVTHEEEHDEDAWAPSDGFERIFYTVLANLVIGVAVSLMILGAMMLRGGPIDARQGLLWGLGGFVAVSLLPSLGLPPELPGTPAADILDRQFWWLATAAASVAGIGLILFARDWPLRLVGLVIIVAPHVIGAPAPPTHAVSYPGGLAGEFVIASIVVSAILWTLSGTAAGWFHAYLARRTA